MSAEILARWQFGITTVYHFFFVPLTIAGSMLVAILQTLWVKTGQDKFLRLTKFYGKLLLINFAMGVVTGIVQEFQFGMNWSEYSRFVGDIFGAPLALEALLAFFLESTFIGLWIFGWDRLPKKLHLMTIWLASIGTLVSSVFILAANSFMQNPVGAVFNPESGRAELANFLDVFSNPVFLTTFPHMIAASWMMACGFFAGIAGWHLPRLEREAAALAKAGTPMEDETLQQDRSTWRWMMKFGAWGLIISGALTFLTGDLQGKVMTEVQPMKMAAAEGLYEGQTKAPFSIVTIFAPDGSREIWSIKVPGVYSFMAKGDFNAHVEGINDLNERYTREYSSTSELTKHYTELQNTAKNAGNTAALTSDRTDFKPNVAVTFWTFRIMMAFGGVAVLIGMWILWSLRKGKSPKGGKLWNAAMWCAPLLPLFGISFGWIFAEMGRQPWLVTGVLPTIAGVSPTVSAGEVLFSMIVYTLLYGVGAVIEVGLMLKYVKLGLPTEVAPVEVVKDEDAPLSFAY
ncbi:MAG: cytochrome ubiquinol oxidase subunit I [Propionibacteriaceae bacterium]